MTEGWASTCPSCGASKITTIQLPRHHEPSEAPSTQRAFRCLQCDTQWTTESEWQDRRQAADLPADTDRQ